MVSSREGEPSNDARKLGPGPRRSQSARRCVAPLACASQIVLAQRGASRPGCSPAVPRGPHRLEEERMNDVLRDRIRRNLEALPEDRLYQVLDYIEFLNSKYARQPVRQGSPFQRFGEKLEDRM